jgi:DNA-directed RNA polymerase specialized sigma24 family protein
MTSWGRPCRPLTWSTTWARRLVPGRADAEDLVQETDLRAWQAWTAGRPPRRVEPWLATICLNLGRDRARRAAPRLEVVAEALDDLADATDVEAEAAARRPALRRVEEVVTSRSDGRD